MTARKIARREHALNKPLWDKLVLQATKMQDPKGEWNQAKGAWVAQQYAKAGGTYSRSKPSSQQGAGAQLGKGNSGRGSSNSLGGHLTKAHAASARLQELAKRLNRKGES